MTIPFLPYALWPLLTLAVVSLWIVAMADIVGHRRARLYTRTRLSCMAAVVSVVAVIAIIGIGGIFAEPHHAAAGERNPRMDGQEDAPVRAYIFSFGLEHVSHPRAGEPARDGSATQTR